MGEMKPSTLFLRTSAAEAFRTRKFGKLKFLIGKKNSLNPYMRRKQELFIDRLTSIRFPESYAQVMVERNRLREKYKSHIFHVEVTEYLLRKEGWKLMELETQKHEKIVQKFKKMEMTFKDTKEENIIILPFRRVHK